jgi:hypothetical protein
LRRLLPTSLASRIALTSALCGLALAAAGLLVGYWALPAQLNARSVAGCRGSRTWFGTSCRRFRTRRALRIGECALDALVLDSGPVRWRSQTGMDYNAVRVNEPLGGGALRRVYLSRGRRHDVHLLTGLLRASVFGLSLMLMADAVGSWLIARTGLAPPRQFRGGHHLCRFNGSARIRGRASGGTGGPGPRVQGDAGAQRRRLQAATGGFRRSRRILPTKSGRR